jgi:hypothetical protein
VTKASRIAFAAKYQRFSLRQFVLQITEHDNPIATDARPFLPQDWRVAISALVVFIFHDTPNTFSLLSIQSWGHRDGTKNGNSQDRAECRYRTVGYSKRNKSGGRARMSKAQSLKVRGVSLSAIFAPGFPPLEKRR